MGVTPQAAGFVVDYITVSSILNSVPRGPSTSRELSHVLLSKGFGKYIDLLYKHLSCVPIMCHHLFQECRCFKDDH